MESMKSAASAYQKVQLDSSILGASPHELIAKLLGGAIDSVVRARQHMLAGEVEAKSKRIDIAVAIISDGLRSCLNMTEGGEIAKNLDALYDYMLRRLVIAHAQNNPAILDEVISLLQEIKAGWDGIKS